MYRILTKQIVDTKSNAKRKYSMKRVVRTKKAKSSVTSVQDPGTPVLSLSYLTDEISTHDNDGARGMSQGAH